MENNIRAVHADCGKEGLGKIEFEDGDLVKICRGNERFWVRAYGRTLPKGCWVGIVDNDLVSLPYEIGDRIEFAEAEVFDKD